ncbi:hypothetical protein [Thalassoglobus neptunius]|nr:hypothetical protein [Thalassoglobus neptunius]
MTATSCCDVSLKKSIPVVITFNGDDYLATAFDIGVTVTGDNELEAFELCREMIEETFLVYAELDSTEQLGPKLKEQFCMMQKFLQVAE